MVRYSTLFRLRLHGVLATLLMLVATGLSCGLANAADASRPNILFILVDDQSPFDLKSYDPNSPLDSPVLELGLSYQFGTATRY